MKRIVLFAILVIILVCLNWFREAYAQDISALAQLRNSDEQTLLKELARTRKKARGDEHYQTPPVFDTTPAPAVPMPPRPTDDTLASPDSTVTHELTPFEELRPFGIELFRSPRETTPPADIATSRDYILGPGDHIIVYLWGRVDKEYELTLDREGKVFVPKVGDINAWGVSIAEFENILKRKLATIYTDFKLSVSLGSIRSIRVYVTGEVQRPGAYTVSSLTSLFNAVFLAGGPNERGSMRDIRLMRHGKKVATLDVYKLLLQGDNSADVRLQSGDAIFVPVAGARVAIRGEINRPAIYELTGGETAADLLTLAGRPTPEAFLDRVMLERISDRAEWKVIDLNLNPADSARMSDVPLADGDRITVYSIFDYKKNIVAVYGHVKHPGHFERSPGMRVSQLVAQAQLQPFDVYYRRANVFRRHEDWRTEVIPVDLRAVLAGDTTADFPLQDHDSLYIYTISEVERERHVTIEGEVKHPGEYELYDSMTVSDLIFLAGSYTRAASRLQAEIARVDSLGNVSLLYVSLRDPQQRRTLLQEDDRVYIRPIPNWQIHRTVTLEGEVLYPGEYVLSSHQETLYDLFMRAGGFTEDAFPGGTVFERRTISRSLRNRKVGSILKHNTPLIMDSTGTYQKAFTYDYDSNAVSRLILDVDRIMRTHGKEGNIVLRPGDRITVPALPSGISVLGAVGAQGTIQYQAKKNVKDYIKLAGGFSPQADKKQTRLIRADGTVYAGGGTLGRRVRIGDVIVVPSKIEKPSNLGRKLMTILSATTGALTTVLLIEKL
ncbi:MAG: hypothetical protein D6800_06205 [Candidatus Zixiibacteriota bacterium]|nr:MAG: hypothetical protein D6800_06205 [candidate division Zixibacteria bacterium]